VGRGQTSDWGGGPSPLKPPMAGASVVLDRTLVTLSSRDINPMKVGVSGANRQC